MSDTEKPVKPKRQRKKKAFAVERITRLTADQLTLIGAKDGMLVDIASTCDNTKQGERWIEKNGEDGVEYRIIGETRRGKAKAQTTMKFE